MNDQDRIVVAIPHYFGPPSVGLRKHSSVGKDSAKRASILRRTVLGLHQAFGTSQCIMQLDSRTTEAANQSYRKKLRVLICTNVDNHLLAEANLPSQSYEHVLCHDPATQLGYACHQTLADNGDSAEWFGYMEDDLLVHDPLWFAKLTWFTSMAGADAVLLPNRFEIGDAMMATKAYVDGDMVERVTKPFQDRADIPEIIGECFGQSLRFVRPKNPHAGCFYLRNDQMKTWTQHASFGERSRAFIGPLESAATLSIMRSFRIYKPAPEQAGFFEIEHQSNQFISQLRRR